MVNRSVEVSNRIREDVIAGRLPAGARITEAELAAALGVSRTPVRTALHSLAAEGLLTYTPNAGFVVRGSTPEEVSGLFEIRAVLNGLVARRAAKRDTTPEWRESMRALMEEANEIAERGEWTKADEQRWLFLRDRFYRHMVQQADNLYLEEMAERMRQLPLLRELRVRWFGANQALEEYQFKREILDAVLNHQPERAAALYEEQVYRFGRLILRAWNEQDSAQSNEVSAKPGK